MLSAKDLMVGGVVLVSVDLQIFYPNSDRESDLVPITATHIFKALWQPVGDKLGLTLVPNLMGGLNIKKDDIPLLIDELDWFEGYIQNEAAHIDSSSKINALSNIRRLITALKEAKDESGEVDLWFY